MTLWLGRNGFGDAPTSAIVRASERIWAGVRMPPGYPEPMASSLRVACVQLNATESKADNIERAERLVAKAAATGADLVLLPEKWNGFGRPDFMRSIAESLDDGETFAAMSDWALDDRAAHECDPVRASPVAHRREGLAVIEALGDGAHEVGSPEAVPLLRQENEVGPGRRGLRDEPFGPLDVVGLRFGRVQLDASNPKRGSHGLRIAWRHPDSCPDPLGGAHNCACRRVTEPIAAEPQRHALFAGAGLPRDPRAAACEGSPGRLLRRLPGRST